MDDKKQAAECDTGRAMWKSFHFLNSDPSYKRPQQKLCVMPKQSHSNELHSYLAWSDGACLLATKAAENSLQVSTSAGTFGPR